MRRKISTSIGSHFKNFINSEERKISELRNALVEGENSTMIENFSAKKHLTDLHKKHL